MKRAQLQQQQQQQQHANAAATASLPLVVGSRAPASPSATAVTGGGGAVVTSLVDQGDNGCANSNDAGSPLMTGEVGGAASNNALRPTVEPEAADAEIIRMMTKCWAEDPLLRPDFSALKVTIRKLNR